MDIPSERVYDFINKNMLKCYLINIKMIRFGVAAKQKYNVNN